MLASRTIVEAKRCCSLSWRAEDITSLARAPGWQKVRPPRSTTRRIMEVPTSSTEGQVWSSCLEARAVDSAEICVRVPRFTGEAARDWEPV